ncbi:hypothetical protein SH661x_000801 [Planctomicrobium sp. SH661]|uniref:hypothetical protein n=1 Tax=Planctomicrobium sp. SH661 TaxID=3448124 RepID=UPI003F5BC946
MLTPCANADGWGSLQGQFVLDGDVPQVPPLIKVFAPGGGCGPGPAPDDSLTFDPENRGIANIFIQLVKTPDEIHPDLKNSQEESLDFNQQWCRFDPHCLIVRTDQTVLCKSSDGAVHNVHTHPFANTPVNLLVQVNDQVGVPVQMPIAERNPVKVQCDIHPWMSAYWLVVDHPYAAVTDKTGKFTIKDLPAGEHEFRVWHERAGSIDKKWNVSIKADETTQLPPREIPLSSFQNP